jgi:hypothetical protein
MNKLSRIAFALGAAALVAAGSNPAFAGEDQWQKHHPRRVEVNGRLANQDRRIHREVREGELSKGQAATLHAEDRGIRSEERTMASQNGGHITRQEQAVLNKQENSVSRQIGR